MISPEPPPTLPPATGATCAGVGAIRLDKWTNIQGEATSDIPLASAPSSSTTVPTFEINQQGDLYGSRFKGYVCAPFTGNYTFYVSGDDQGELFLSGSEDPAGKERIAFFDSWTPYRSLTAQPSQKSTAIPLEAGKKYYIEALHKEGAGGDSLSVGWDLPSGAREFPLGAARLIPAPASVVVTPPTTPPVPPAPTTGGSLAEPSAYSAPLVITRGGTYSGNWRTTAMGWDSYAVKIQTQEPVIIQNCHLAGPGILINARYALANLTVRNCVFHGYAPTMDNQPRGRAIDLTSFKHAVIENNHFESTGTPVAALEYKGNGTTETIKVRFNRVRNISGMYRNSKVHEHNNFQNFVAIGAYLNGNVAGGEIAWNDVINEPGKSSSEDLINFNMAGGQPSSWFKVHNNFLKGSYHPDPYDPDGSAGGVQIDGPSYTMSSNIEVHNNTVLQISNGGIGAASGSNVYMHHNRVISSSKSPTGVEWEGSFAGLWIFKFYPEGGANGYQTNIRIEENVVGWIKGGYNFPYPNRLDWHSNVGGGIKNNTHLPDAPITLATEANEYQLYLNKVQAAGIKIGPQ